MRCSLFTYLNPDIVGDLVLVEEHAAELKVGVRRGRVCDLDLLEANLDKVTEEAQLLRVGHGCNMGSAGRALKKPRLKLTVGERLVAIAEVGGEPDGSGLALLVGPRTGGVRSRLEGRIADRGVSAVRGVSNEVS